MNEKIEEVLISLRRIIRATDMHSKKLLRASGLTAPQLLILQSIYESQVLSPGQIAKEIGLTQATVTTILDRLEARKLVTRHRSDKDKRRVFVELTEDGVKKVVDAPTPLQDEFIASFNSLKDWEQSFIIAALQKTAGMMDAEKLDASPVLDIGAMDRTSELIPVPVKNEDENSE